MKFAGYILSFYLILLAAVPCCTIDNCPDDQTEQTADHEEGDEDCGTCSPFFNCEGCAAATIAYELPQFEFIAPVTSPVYAIYQQHSLSQIELDFWQPPKIS